MTPVVQFLSASEAIEACCGEDEGCSLGAGYYGRLSASGYMDCTEWSGPFDTARAAYCTLADAYRQDDPDETPDEAIIWEELFAACEEHDAAESQKRYLARTAPGFGA